MPTEPSKRVRALLFDMDGTILTSLAAAERVWTRWAIRHGLDVATFLPTMHGSRAIDTIRRQNLPGIDAEAETQWVVDAELVDVGGIDAISGARGFLASLPVDRWALVTSAPADLAAVRMQAAGLPLPATMVTAEDITAGKPDPSCFILGARRLGFPIEDCLVFEDAPAGIRAGEASGADVVVITAMHAHPLETPHRTIAGYDHVRVHKGDDGWLTVAFDD